MLKDVKMEEIMHAFIKAVEIVNPILKNHHRRTAIIAYHIGMQCGLSEKSMANLVVAAALHDIGALTVEDAESLAVLDVHNPHPHEQLGASMLSSYKAFGTIKDILMYHHVRYDKMAGSGQVPPEAYVLHLADRVEILLKPDVLALNQREGISEKIKEYSGSLFDPILVTHFLELSKKELFWFDIEDLNMDEILSKVNMELISQQNDRESLEELVHTLSKVIDYKCEFTASHSIGVAYTAYHLAQYLGLPAARCNEVKIAGYLHDIGKLAVPTEIITKKACLTTDEFNMMKAHPYYTFQILKNISGLSEIALWAGSHHERSDLSGYPRKPSADNLNLEISLIAYSDVFTALCEDRPYRKALPIDEVMDILSCELRCEEDDIIYLTLLEHSRTLYEMLRKLQHKAKEEYFNFVLMNKTPH